MGAVISCVRLPLYITILHGLTNNLQIEGVLHSIGHCLMTIVHAIGSILRAIVDGVVVLCDAVISCVTCGYCGKKKRSRV